MVFKGKYRAVYLHPEFSPVDLRRQIEGKPLRMDTADKNPVPLYMGGDFRKTLAVGNTV